MFYKDPPGPNGEGCYSRPAGLVLIIEQMSRGEGGWMGRWLDGLTNRWMVV